jgi:hypothetical protein
MTGASGSIGLDPDQITALETKIDLVRGQLGTDQPILDDGSLQSAAVDDALHDFNGAWSDRRSKLLELLAQSAQFLAAARETFVQIDESLAGSFDGSLQPASDGKALQGGSER